MCNQNCCFVVGIFFVSRKDLVPEYLECKAPNRLLKRKNQHTSKCLSKSKVN